MPRHLQMLLSRGYWEQAGDDKSTGGGSGTDDTNTSADDSGSDEDTTGDDKSSSSVSDKEAKLLKELMGKKDKLKTANDALSQANAKLKEYEGLDPVKMRKLVSDAEAAEEKQLEAKGAWDALKKQMNDQHTAALAAKDTEVTTVKGERDALSAKISELTVGNAFGLSKFIAEKMARSVRETRVLFGSHFEFDGENVVAYDKPAGAKNRAVLVNAQGDPLAFEAALEKLVQTDPDKDSLLKSSVKPGNGSGTENRRAPNRTQEMSSMGRIAAGLAKMRAS